MGANSEMHIEMQEEELLYNETEYSQLIDRLISKTETLSYSSLKRFGESPRNFINYKLQPRKPQTESQIFGSLCDCYLTTPEKIEEMFAIVSSFPKSENQIGFCNDMIAGKTKEEAYAANYKVGGVDKVYSALSSYIEAILSKKQVCTEKQKEEAFKITENLKKSDFVMQYIDSCDSFQNKKEWSFRGWKFKGFTDCEGKNIIIDLKYSKTADPDKFEREIVNYDYFMQMGM